MKKNYIKPNTNVVIVNSFNGIMTGSNETEPEVTENIGAKEMDFVIFSEDNITCNDIWNDKTE